MFIKQPFGPRGYSEPDYNMGQKGHCWNFEIGRRCLNKPCGFMHATRKADDKNNKLCIFYAQNACRNGIDCPFRHDINLPAINQQYPPPNFGPNSFIQPRPQQQFQPRPQQQFQQKPQQQFQQKPQLKSAIKSPGQDEKGYEMYLQKKSQQKTKFSPKFEYLESSDEEEAIKPQKKQKTPIKARAKIDSSDDDEDDKKKQKTKRKLVEYFYSSDDEDVKPQKKQRKYDDELDGSELKRLYSDKEYVLIKKRK